jgi:DNA-binding beta-propeller fold protein YncE
VPAHGLSAATGRPAAALVTVSQTRLPKAYSLVLVARYGAVWLAGTGVTYAIDAVTGKIVRTIPTPGTGAACRCATEMAAGAGAVWVTHGCRGIYRIDPHTGRVTGSLRAPGAIDAIAAAGGLLWVIDGHGLLPIQPRTGQATGKPIPVGAGNWLLTPGAGALWVSSGDGLAVGTVVRVDLATGAVKPLANPTATDVQAVGAGSLWTLQGTSQVQRINPVTGKTTGSVFLGTSGVVFWRGSAWVLTLQRSLTLLRIDPTASQVTGTPVPVGKPLPAAVALAGSPPAVIAAGPTGLWVLDYHRNLLYHVTMRPARA